MEKKSICRNSRGYAVKSEFLDGNKISHCLVSTSKTKKENKQGKSHNIFFCLMNLCNNTRKRASIKAMGRKRVETFTIFMRLHFTKRPLSENCKLPDREQNKLADKARVSRSGRNFSICER